MKDKSLKYILLSPLLLFLFIFLLPPKVKAENLSSQIQLSVSIGEPKLSLFGYSSPQSLVQLGGNRVAEEVIADKEGYFFFDRIFLPLPNPEYPELCLMAIDTQSRTSFPTCLPRLPIGPYHISVGPVLLSPTISLEKGIFLSQEQIIAEGLTIPHAKVNIFLANDRNQKRFSLIPQTYAYSLPTYQTKADKNGHFEFNLPNEKESHWKLFAGATFQNSPTPKSNTLSFQIIPWWSYLLKRFLSALMAFLSLAKPSFWIILLVETMAIVFLLRKHHQQAKKKRINGS